MLNIYKASAGSGKTYTLAYEYVRMVLAVKPQGSKKYILNHPKHKFPPSVGRNRHRAILAITFTNKATEEMKSRIIKEIQRLSAMPKPGEKDANYAKRLCDELICTRQELALVAKNALEELLYDYHYFHVTTIDSFFQSVLRTFARELDRQGDFSIEIDDRAAVQRAVDTMLDDFNQDPAALHSLEQWILGYVISKMKEGKKSNFFNRRSHLHSAMIDLASKICEEKFKKHQAQMRRFFGLDRPEEGADPIELSRKLVESMQEIIDGLPAALRPRVENTVGLLAKDGVTLDQLNQQKSTKKIICALIDDNPVLPAEFTDSMRRVAEGDDKTWTKKFKGTEVHKKMLCDVLKEIQAAVDKAADLKKLATSLTQMSVLGYVWKYLDNFVAENNTVLLSDTNQLLSRIIGDDETPFIYERMGVELHNFLIDEFQDTSRMQWENLRPLVANGLSDESDSLIIGDEKQSIYRFRNSDSSLLHHQVAEVDFPKPEQREVHGSKPGQNTNYRSSADVVRFNNTLFTILSGSLHIEGYENVIQEICDDNKDLDGYIHFVPFAKPDKKGPDTSDGEDDAVDAADQENLKLMAENIMRQHDEGKYSWADIAVLVNRNKEAAQVVEYLVNSHPDIPVISDEALFVNKSSAVQTIVGLLELFACNSFVKTDSDTCGNKYPSAAQTAIMISRYKYFKKCGLDEYSAIDKAIRIDDDDDVSLHRSLEKIRSMRPSTLQALIETIVHEHIPPEERLSQMAYISAFQDYVSDYCSRFNPSVSAFLAHWKGFSSKYALPAPANIDAVRVMTIHKSKGLEFACVHIPFGSWEEVKTSTSMWVKFPDIPELEGMDCPPAVYVTLSKNSTPENSIFYPEYSTYLQEALSDNLNKTYVAYTRAGRELTVYYDPGKNLGKTLAEAFSTPTDFGPAPWVTDLPSHFCADTGELVIGAPTVKVQEEKDKKDGSEAGPEEPKPTAYNVYIHPDAEVLTSLTDMLGLDSDIDDESDSDTAPLSPIDVYADEAARLRGIRLHDVLSRVVEKKDLSKAVKFFATIRRYDADMVQEATELIEKMLQTPDVRVQRWFGGEGRVLTEQSIYLPATGKERRIDRAVFCPDGSVDIIDYKFTSATHPVHRKQVINYINIMHKMGYKRVRGYLWYPMIEGAPIIEID